METLPVLSALLLLLLLLFAVPAFVIYRDVRAGRREPDLGDDA